jgi:hypothetical protein
MKEVTFSLVASAFGSGPMKFGMTVTSSMKAKEEDVYGV